MRPVPTESQFIARQTNCIFHNLGLSQPNLT